MTHTSAAIALSSSSTVAPSRVEIPALYCPFESACSDLAHAVNEATLAWAASTGVVRTERGASKLRASRIGWLSARAFPHARREGLQLVSDWTALFCLLDDRCESLSPFQLSPVLAALLDAFRSRDAGPRADAFAVAMASLGSRIEALSSPAFTARFADRLEALFVGFSWEATHRAAGVRPAFASYLDLREITVGLHPQFELFELTDGVALPDEVRAHPDLAAMRAASALAVGLANDIFTCERERLEGEVHNVVLVLMHREGLSLREAIARAVALHDERVRALAAMSRALPSFGDRDDDVRRYAAMLCGWVRAHLDWARETGRYSPSYADGVCHGARAVSGVVPAVRSSRIPGFYKESVERRQRLVAEVAGFEHATLARAVERGGLDATTADKTVENVLGTYALPFAVGLNVKINGRDRLVPMVVEEPSVVAAMSNAARMIREGGGFDAEHDAPLMVAQVQLWEVRDPVAAAARVEAAAGDLLAMADAAVPGLVARGGGAREVEARDLGDGLFVVHLVVDVRDAMGANLVNTVAEHLAPTIAALTGGVVGLRILSNLSDRRCVRVRCSVPVGVLATETRSGDEVRDGVVRASKFAERDPYRAATHNKGIMNGVDAVVMATGNDWRAVEAGAHAFAARRGRYEPLATWRVGDDGSLVGEIEMPLALGIVGGTLRVHPGARVALQIAGVRDAQDLACVAAAAGLASNLAALRALASEGIQRGHMALHARSVAVAGGATGDEVDRVAEALSAAGEVNVDTARRAVAALRSRAA
jgi:hydroxymethylglutaryl-CoA reductase